MLKYWFLALLAPRRCFCAFFTLVPYDTSCFYVGYASIKWYKLCPSRTSGAHAQNSNYFWSANIHQPSNNPPIEWWCQSDSWFRGTRLCGMVQRAGCVPLRVARVPIGSTGRPINVAYEPWDITFYTDSTVESRQVSVLDQRLILVLL